MVMVMVGLVAVTVMRRWCDSNDGIGGVILCDGNDGVVVVGCCVGCRWSWKWSGLFLILFVILCFILLTI